MIRRAHRLERERQERMREQMARQADPVSHRTPRLDTQPVARRRLTAAQVDERIARAIECALEAERERTVDAVRVMADLADAVDRQLGKSMDQIRDLKTEVLRLKEVNLDIRSELIEARKAVTGEPVLRRLPAAH